jgi:hypothetical protein
MASRGFQIRPRQIHQGLGASGANPKGQVQAREIVRLPALSSLVDLGLSCRPEARPGVSALIGALTSANSESSKGSAIRHPPSQPTCLQLPFRQLGPLTWHASEGLGGPKGYRRGGEGMFPLPILSDAYTIEAELGATISRSSVPATLLP